jgi:hypothetical protein
MKKLFLVESTLCWFGAWSVDLLPSHFERRWFMLACFARPSKLLSAKPILVLPLVFTRGIQFASSPAAVNTVGDLDSGPDQTCLKIHFLASSLLLLSDLGPACDFYARVEPLQLA